MKNLFVSRARQEPPAWSDLRDAVEAPPIFAQKLQHLVASDPKVLGDKRGVAFAGDLMERAKQRDVPETLSTLCQTLRTLPVEGSARRTRDSLVQKYDASRLAPTAWDMQLPNLAWARVAQGDKSAAEYVRTFRAPALRRQVERGAASPSCYLDLVRDSAAALSWVLSDTMTAAQYLYYFPAPSPEHVQAMRAGKKLSAFLYLQSGCMPEADLRARLGRGAWTAAFCLAAAPLPTGLLRQQLASGALTLTDVARETAHQYRPERPLPLPLLESWAASASLDTVLRELVLPGAPSDPRRQSFAARAMAQWILAHDPAYRPVVVAHGVSSYDRCSSCFDDFTAEAPGVALESCTHPPCLDLSCMLQQVDKTRAVCPDPHCGKAMTPNDMLTLGLGAARADELALDIVRRHVRALGDWAPCPTDDCVGGFTATSFEPVAYDCKACDFSGPITSRVTREERRMVRQLLADMAPGSHNQLQNCPHCDVPTQKSEGCDNMTCTSCKKPYVRTYITTGRTVPSGGLLVRAGIYDGFAAGHVVATVTDRKRLLDNARKFGFLGPDEMPPNWTAAMFEGAV